MNTASKKSKVVSSTLGPFTGSSLFYAIAPTPLKLLIKIYFRVSQGVLGFWGFGVFAFLEVIGE